MIPHTVAVPDGLGSLSGDQEHDDAQEKHEHDQHTGGEERAVRLREIDELHPVQTYAALVSTRDPMTRLAK